VCHNGKLLDDPPASTPAAEPKSTTRAGGRLEA
jgi:hypothetical protein